jgi:alanyl-tRNA synthetase
LKQTPELNELQISAVKKIQFRDSLANFTKQVIAYKKEKVAGMTNKIVDKAAAAAPSTDGSKVVLRYDFGADGKMAKSIMTAYGKR